MNNTYIAKATITIQAPTPKVWGALTKPHLIKQYMFGTDVTTDWKEGSPITYTGIWNGKPYEDKGKILQFEPEKQITSTYWSPLSGVPDAPENYKTVGYHLSAEGSATRLTNTQDNNETQEEASHSEQNWHMVLEGIKKLVESGG